MQQRIDVRRGTILEGIWEYPELLWTSLVVRKRNFVEFCKVAARYYYPTLSFMSIDQALLRQYFFRGPYKISKTFLKNKGAENIYAYGETPLTTVELIAETCQFKASDTIFELGCGRGRTCFWLNAFIHCKVVGIDFIPDFIDKATTVKKQYNLKDITFRCEDFLQSSLKDATIIYINGTCYDTPFIEQLAEKLSHVPAGTKIITVSYPLTEYTKKPVFEVMKRFEADFTWGTADVYLQQRK
jgi:SAM-dependent methyltransferase